MMKYKKYSRFQYGAAQIDDLTGEQLTCGQYPDPVLLRDYV